ncbi:MAG: ribonuclease Z [candidate division KSB1 bacterium]|nr:ribonuclease Z [candidate division KSB1 bacterium]
MTTTVSVVFLGTGASLPSPERNVSAAVLCSDRHLYLLDCGEGTQQRLMSAGLSPTRISSVFISHLHGDHLFGLAGYLTSQQLLQRQELLNIYGPPGLQHYIRCMQQVAGYDLNYPVEIIEIDPGTPDRFMVNEFTVQTAGLEHKVPVIGYRFEEAEKPGKFDPEKAHALGVEPGPDRARLQGGHPVKRGSRTVYPDDVLGPPIPGRIITYCTDTRPCDAAVELARNSDLLIHESTFSDEFQERARFTQHSTAREAAQIARSAGALRLALYHISMRFHKNSDVLLAQAGSEFASCFIPK